MGLRLECGIVGLPNSGKSTLFNALLRRQIAAVAEYPYTTIEPNVGVVEVPDDRLERLAAILVRNPSATLRTSRPPVIPAAVRFIDIAGLIKGAHKGEGLGNQFLSHIREVDAILHVVRAFDPSTSPSAASSGPSGSGQAISHVMGDVNPVRDVEVVNLELELGGIKKPAVYVLNVSEADLKKDFDLPFDYLKISAKLEAELSDLSEAEQKAYLTELGIGKSGLDQVILASYKLLDLITFFTVAGGKQSQAWPLRRGETALAASSLVHSDFEKKFIKAEVIPWDELVTAGSWSKARSQGLLKIAGKDEIVQDGDVIEFKI